MLKITFVVGVLLLATPVCSLWFTNNRNPFEYPCPPNCLDTTCTSSGCINCAPGYCRYQRPGSRNSPGICLNECPDGYGCYHGSLRHCTRCNIENCVKCTILGGGSWRNICTQCERRYRRSRDSRSCVRS